MLKRLKRKFLVAALLALITVIGVIVGAINIVNFTIMVSEADDTLSLISKNSGRFPNLPEEDPDSENPLPDFDISLTPESPFESRYFSIIFSGDNVRMVYTANIAAIDPETAVDMAREVIEENKHHGFCDNYRYLITHEDERDKTTVIFLDCTKVLGNAGTFLLLSVLMSVVGLAGVFLLLCVASEKIVSPISDGYEKQKRFITDAGHDIKTPITIIDADAELLEMEIGENEWLDDIKKQTSRLASLTGDLIYLSRMEETVTAPHQDFPISDIVEEVSTSFVGLAKTNGIKLRTIISPAIYYHGDENAMRKLITLLLDNAIKYSPYGGEVEISLATHNKSIHIYVSNPAENLTDETVRHMFDRFYRSDPARSSNGGFGIGLSVASAIVSSHKGRISAEKVGDLLTITVIL